jgi:hypothetical protein
MFSQIEDNGSFDALPVVDILSIYIHIQAALTCKPLQEWDWSCRGASQVSTGRNSCSPGSNRKSPTFAEESMIGHIGSQKSYRPAVMQVLWEGKSIRRGDDELTVIWM